MKISDNIVQVQNLASDILRGQGKIIIFLGVHIEKVNTWQVTINYSQSTNDDAKFMNDNNDLLLEGVGPTLQVALKDIYTKLIAIRKNSHTKARVDTLKKDIAAMQRELNELTSK